MVCACIKGIPGFDIYVKVINKNKIIFTDLSQWVDDETYTIPEKFSVVFILPDNTEHKVYLNANSNTVLNSSDLNINYFPDGLYKFIIKDDDEESGGCGLYYEKELGILPNLECCIISAFSTNGDKYEQIKEVVKWYNNAILSSQLSKPEQFKTEWKIAKNLLEKLNCNCSQIC